MNRPATNLLLVLFGVAIGLAALTGTYLDYVRPVMFWFLLASAVVILILAGVDMIDDASGAAHGEEGAVVEVDGDAAEFGGAHPPEGSAHEHAHGGHAIAWLLVPPVLLLLFAPPPPLTPDATPGSLQVAAATGAPRPKVYPPLPAGPAPELPLYDFWSRAYDDSTGSLNGRDVTLTGVVRRVDGRVNITRLMIWCCVADARTLVIRMANPPPDVPTDGQWVRAVVRLVPGSSDAADGYTPEVTVVSARPADRPDSVYAY